MNLPEDRSHVTTEQRHPESMNLDALRIGDQVELMVEDHQQVIDAVRRARHDLEQFIAELASRYRLGGRLIYIGAGTSGRLGVLDASECPPTFNTDPGRVVGIIAGGDVSLRRSSESREDDPQGAAGELESLAIGERDTLLGIAAGGTTPYVRGAIEMAAKKNALTGLLTCASSVEAPRGCDHLICLDTGPELLAGSTRLKAGSATKLALNIISTALFVECGKVYSNLMVDLRATNDKLRDRAIRVLIELHPGLSRKAAFAKLNDAGGELKTALVMDHCNVDRGEARRRLDACAGRLRSVISPSPS